LLKIILQFLIKIIYKILYSLAKSGALIGVFENRVLRRIFGPKREEAAGGWRRLHNEELCNL